MNGSNLIETQELGKPRPKVIPKPIRDIIQRMHDLREERYAKQEAAKKKEAKANFDALALLDEVK